MGSSSRKKSKKKEDFQKPKLKVGKARPKPTNFTDTSFKSKTIALPSQSLSTAAPSLTSQVKTHLSLLSSKSADQRYEHLRALTTQLDANGSNLPISTSEIIQRIRELILDPSNNIRAQLVKILPLLHAGSLHDAVPDMLLRIRAGLTHISPDLRSTSVDLFAILLEMAPYSVVTCAGGFLKSLKTLFTGLAWPLIEDANDIARHKSNSKGWSGFSVRTSGVTTASSSIPHTKKLLSTLSSFLRTTLLPNDRVVPPASSRTYANFTFPLQNTKAYMVSTKSNAYAYLNLFGIPRDMDSEMYEYLSDRVRVWRDLHLDETARRGADALIKEGGEIGRAAGDVAKVLKLIEKSHELNDPS